MSEFFELCKSYDEISRALAALKKGKASFQLILPDEDMNMDDHFPEMGEKMANYMAVYLIDLRRQIRDMLQVDEAELQIDKVCIGMFGKEKRDAMDQG